MSEDREVAIGLVLNAARFNPAVAQAAGGLATLAGEAAKADGDVRRLEAGLTLAAADLKRVEAEAARTASSLRALDVELAKANGELAAMKTQAKTSAAEAQRLAVDIGQLTARIGGLEAEAKRAAAGMAKLEAENKRLATEMGTMRTQAAAAAAELQRMQAQATQASTGTSGLTQAAGLLKGALATMGVAYVAHEMLDLAVGTIKAADSMDQYKIQIAAVISANEKVYDSQGKLVTGVEKFGVAQEQASAIFKKIEKDAMLTADTTEGLVEKFKSAVGPGLAAGLDLNEVEDLTVTLSVAMSALGVDASQAKSEIKALLTGDELDNSDLARSLGIRKEDIKLAKEQGKLYEMLSAKMADFRTAGAAQSQTLSGVLSGLDDLRGRLQALSGQDATDTLTSGFASLLNSIQNADGSLTPFGKDLEHLARVGGSATDDLAFSFVELVNLVLGGGAKVASVFADIMLSIKKVGSTAGAYAGSSDMAHEIQTIKDGIRNAKEWDRNIAAATRRGVLPGTMIALSKRPMNMREQSAQERRLGSLEMYIGQAEGAGYVQEIEDATRLTTGRFSDSRKKGSYKTVPNPPAPAPGKKAPKGPKGKDPGDVAVSNLMGEMNQKLALADSFGPEFALEARIPIMQRYLVELRKLSKGSEEAQALDRKIEQERAKNSADLIKQQKDGADKSAEVSRIRGESMLKMATSHAKAELAQAKAANAATQRALQEGFQAGTTNAETYYEGLARIQQQAIAQQHAETRKQLEGERALLQDEYKQETGRTGRDFNQVKSAQVKAKIDEIDAALADLPAIEASEIAAAWDDAQGSIRKATADATREGLELAFDTGLKVLGVQLPAQLQQGLSKAIQLAMASSGVKNSMPGLGGAAGGIPGLALEFAGKLGLDAHATAERNAKKNAELRVGLHSDLRGYAPGLDSDMADIEDWFNTTSSSYSLTAGRNPAESAAMEEFQQNLIKVKALKQDKASTDEWARVRAVSDSQANAEDGMFGDLEAIFAKRLARGETTTAQELERLKKLRDAYTRDGAFREGLEDRIYDLTKTLSDKKAADAKELAEKQMEWARRTADEQSQQAQRAAKYVIDQLQRVRSEQDKALDAKRDSDDILAIYGLKSPVAVESQDRQARVQANKDEIARLAAASSDERTKQTPLLDQLGSLRLVNNSGDKTLDDGSGTGLGPMKYTNYAANLGTIDKDRALLVKFIEASGKIVDRTTGTILDRKDLEAIFDQVKGYEATIDSNDAKAEAARQANTGLSRDNEKQYATIRTASVKAREQLDLERAKLEVGSDPAKMKEYAKAQADADYLSRKSAFEAAGLLSDTVDPAERARILANLDSIREFAKAQAEKADPTDERPLPVRVVEMPRTFALPTASYFRQAASIDNSTKVTIAKDAVRIDGSGLSEAQLSKAVTDGIVSAAPLVAKVVKRENTIDDGRIRTS